MAGKDNLALRLPNSVEEKIELAQSADTHVVLEAIKHGHMTHHS